MPQSNSASTKPMDVSYFLGSVTSLPAADCTLASFNDKSMITSVSSANSSAYCGFSLHVLKFGQPPPVAGNTPSLRFL